MNGAVRSSIERLMAPRSVAIVGASDRPGAPAGHVMRNLLAQGFAGPVLPVHPSASSVLGLAAVRRLADLAGPVDAVVIGVAAERVLGVIEEAAELGIKAAVVLASGFAELDDAGRDRQARLAASARAASMAVCGPNCLGIVNVANGATLYSSRVAPGMRKGGVAIVSHSGASAIALANSGRIGVSHIVSAGNAAVTDTPDYLRYFAADPTVRAAALFLETIRDAGDFAGAVAEMRAADKPVIALKVGRSQKAAAASAAHTGGLVGSAVAFDAFFRRIGVVAVRDFDEMIETATLLGEGPTRARGRALGIIAVSGGGAAHVCDIAEEIGLAVPDIGEAATARLREILPPFGTPANPLDATGAAFGDANLYPRALAALAADPAIDLIAAIQDVPPIIEASDAADYLGIAGAVADHHAGGGKPIVFVTNLSLGIHPDVARRLAASGAPALNGTRAGLRAIHNAMRAGDPVRGMKRAAGAIAPSETWLRRLAGTPLVEREAKAFLADHGLPTTRERLARNAEEAVAAAVAIGFPVALKVESADIPHKSEIGGVRLGLADAEAVGRAYLEIMETAATRAPGAKIEGVLVQEMVSGGVEVLLGLARYEPFGLALVVGAGGVLVELVRDSAVGLLPLDRVDAEALIDATRLPALLSGYRGAPAADRAALVEAIVTLGLLAMAYGERLEAVDLNPVTVLAAGKGVAILDALVITRSAGKP
jgi:acyl-CoA synthetase (NDP forming)